MKHLSEAQLALHYYGDADGSADLNANGDFNDARSIERHLAECDQCRREFAQLRTLLKSLDSAVVPERPANYGTDVWNRIRAHLPERPPRRSPFAWLLTPQRWAAAGAMAAIVLAAFFVGRWFERGAPAPTAPSGQVAGGPQNTSERGTSRDRVLMVAVGDHLERSQMVLVELVNARSGGNVDISAEQSAA